MKRGSSCFIHEPPISPYSLFWIAMVTIFFLVYFMLIPTRGMIPRL